MREGNTEGRRRRCDTKGRTRFFPDLLNLHFQRRGIPASGVAASATSVRLCRAGGDWRLRWSRRGAIRRLHRASVSRSPSYGHLLSLLVVNYLLLLFSIVMTLSALPFLARPNPDSTPRRRSWFSYGNPGDSKWRPLDWLLQLQVSFKPRT